MKATRLPLSLTALTLSTLALAAALLSGCGPAATGGSFSVPGYVRSQEDAAESLVALIQCSPELAAQNGERATQVGTTSHAALPVMNAGESELVIDGVEIWLRAADGSLDQRPQSIFGFSAPGPDVPLSISPGETYAFSVSFSPQTAGVQRADILFKTSAGDKMVRLLGRGAWILNLEVPNLNYGRIVRPIPVEANQSRVYLAVEPDVVLEAQTTHPLGLSELQAWSVQSGAANFSGSATSTALITTVTLSGTATVRATFITPYIFVSTTGNDANAGTSPGAPVLTLARGILRYWQNAATMKGMAISQGAFAMAEQDNLPPGLLRGGYATDFLTRPPSYAPSVQAGTAGATATSINTSSWHLIMDGSTLNPATLLEGFSIAAGPNTAIAGLTEDRLSVGIAVLNGASPTIRDCVFSGGADSRNSVGAYIYKASPTFERCVLKGAAVSEQGGRSVGLWCNTESSPSLTACLLSGGTANVTYGNSYGVLNANYAASPRISACWIDSGSSSEASYAFWSSYGGRPELRNNQIFTRNAAAANYGVYLGPNGRCYALSGNNFYACGTGLVYWAYNDTTYTDIDAVNEQWVSGWDESYGYTDNTSVAP